MNMYTYYANNFQAEREVNGVHSGGSPRRWEVVKLVQQTLKDTISVCAQVFVPTTFKHNEQ